jgi:hypothetical protein
MTDRPRSAFTVWLVALAIVLLPVAYVLSAGPMIWLAARGYVPDEVGLIYAPLAFLANCFPAIRRLLNWYVGLWQ